MDEGDAGDNGKAPTGFGDITTGNSPVFRKVPFQVQEVPLQGLLRKPSACGMNSAVLACVQHCRNGKEGRRWSFGSDMHS